MRPCLFIDNFSQRMKDGLIKRRKFGIQHRKARGGCNKLYESVSIMHKIRHGGMDEQTDGPMDGEINGQTVLLLQTQGYMHIERETEKD